MTSNGRVDTHECIKYRILTKESPCYNEAVKISNLRLELAPQGVFYCKNVNDVKEILAYCNPKAKKAKKKFKIRSGGHHHEGACSGNDVIVIDTSRLVLEGELKSEGYILNDAGNIAINIHEENLIVTSGAKLKEVYKFLKSHNYILPGGGCDSVAIGGLALGAGWGPYSRLHGMTCDALLEAKLVVANNLSFQEITVSNNDGEKKKLFEALKGSGGGNFGVITQLKFKIYPLSTSTQLGHITAIDVKFEDLKTAKKFTIKWMENAHKSCESITSFARVIPSYTNNEGKKVNSSFYVMGFITEKIGLDSGYSKSVLEDAKNRALISAKKKFASLFGEMGKNINKFSVNHEFYCCDSIPNFKLDMGLNGDEFSQSLEDMSSQFLTSLPVSLVTNSNTIDAPKSTCDVPHPHKVSSFFPKGEEVTRALVDSIYKYMEQDFDYLDSQVSCYLSLHGMGGAIKRGNNSFFYKEKPFILQIQSWWTAVNNPNAEKYLIWVEGLRKKLSSHTEGSFVNFPDYNCVLDKNHKIYNPDNLKQRKLLFESFFGKENKNSLLSKLKKQKRKYDSHNIFNHSMSIINTNKS
ncbi:FAD-binding oxidoreductase [Sphingobacterium sp. MYb382]|uniref:FAD-binding oxidoreductase n=1 Tax=Sphingobacterium sp. MYb382 TaxID=2745278 RepID=UPI0030B26265